MGERMISIRALMVLASELGAEHFYGVRDPFLMMGMDEIHVNYERCLKELEQMGIIARRLDGISVISNDLRRQILVCTNCDLYLTKESIISRKSQPSSVYYRNGEKWVCLRKENDMVCLTDTNADAVVEDALMHPTHYCDMLEIECVQTHWSITNQTLQSCLHSAAEGRAELLADKIPADVVELLLKGLAQRCCYCCINVVDLRARTLESVCLVYDANSLLQLSSSEGDTTDWVIRRQAPTQIQNAIFSMIQEGAS